MFSGNKHSMSIAWDWKVMWANLVSFNVYFYALACHFHDERVDVAMFANLRWFYQHETLGNGNHYKCDIASHFNDQLIGTLWNRSNTSAYIFRTRRANEWKETIEKKPRNRSDEMMRVEIIQILHPWTSRTPHATGGRLISFDRSNFAIASHHPNKQ